MSYNMANSTNISIEKMVVNEPACVAIRQHISRVPLTLSLLYTGPLRQKHTVALSSQIEQQKRDTTQRLANFLKSQLNCRKRLMMKHSAQAIKSKAEVFHVFQFHQSCSQTPQIS
ncbi:hypothetical protein WUBG_16160 [Wuchereria bancrofti]|uniref:Uncharacterized protein n=1 Tax=Wuchereria bancrofti TaxID=6293 RepID=J9E7G5_WUCBA|nr:hypothetical protein WUBG_16160 [Wuchereria bancrofti]